jgi:SAM-dependent methyltransferase
MSTRIDPLPEAEAEARAALLGHFQRLGYWNAADAVGASMSLDGAASRFDTLRAAHPDAFAPDRKVLVSGMSAGSEMIAVRRLGFREVWGTEVDRFYVELCQTRFRGLDGFHPDWYDGSRLEWPAGAFDLVVSGHIIEHTADPAAYLAEHLRVLVPGGLLFLEFPTRYHHTELHTNLPSLEWLPRRVRDAALRLLSSPRSPLGADTKRRCRSIVDTALKQVSMGSVRRWARTADAGIRVTVVARVAPGILRCVIRKSG